MPEASILLVDDNLDILSLLRLYLEREGFKVVTADNCQAASRLLADFRPDIIITDILLPKITGLEFIRWIKQQEQLADVPIIAMSAYGKTQRGAAAIAGADVVLDKPDDFENLVNAINQLLLKNVTTTIQPTLTSA